jgi:hypothetical protein
VRVVWYPQAIQSSSQCLIENEVEVAGIEKMYFTLNFERSIYRGGSNMDGENSSVYVLG